MSAVKIDPKIRQVAVLLASVDSQTARQLLGQLPTEQAKQVRQAMVHLGKVSPEERRQALAMFHKMTQGNSPSTAKTKPSPAELAVAQGASIDSFELSEASRSATPAPRGIDLERSTDVYGAPSEQPVEEEHQWHHLDCHDLSELLAEERAIVIAVVLNQIPVPLAASLLPLLPKPLAMSAVAALPRLQSTPADILKEIHQHLHQKIADYQLPKKSSEQNLRRVQAILDAAHAGFREACRKNIVEQEPMIARKLGWVVPAQPDRAHVPTTTSSIEPTFEPYSMERRFEDSPEMDPMAGPAEELLAASDSVEEQDEVVSIPFPTKGSDAKANSDSDPTYAHGSTIRMSFEELASLPLSDLAAVLRASEPTVILLALSGAPESIFKRVKSMLHPRDGKRLEDKLTKLGPIQLSDIDLAQKRLCELATEMLASGKIGSLVSMTITAAA